MMMMPTPKLFPAWLACTLLGLTLTLTLSQPAQAIFQCDKAGHTTFQDKPCPAGSVSRQLAEPPPVNASEMARAKQNATLQKQQLTKLEAEKAKQAQLDSKLAASHAKQNARTLRQCNTLAMKQKWAEQDAEKAEGKARGKAQTKARRAAEKYQSVCAGK